MRNRTENAKSKTDPKERSHRVRPLALAVCGTYLLLLIYVLSYGGFRWWEGRRLGADRTGLEIAADEVLMIAYSPVELYSRTDYPCAVWISKWQLWCWSRGVHKPRSWADVGKEVEANRRFGRGNSS